MDLEADTMITPILQLREMGLREARILSLASKSQDLNPSSVAQIQYS